MTLPVRPDGLTRGPHGTRGQVRFKHLGPFNWQWSVCVGGTTWTQPRRSRTRRHLRSRAFRALLSTPNRETRRAIAVLNK
jgi:hypothetical protein